MPPYEGPVLWLAGADSRYVSPKDAEAMRALFPRVRLVTVKGASHWVHTDAPDGRRRGAAPLLAPRETAAR